MIDANVGQPSNILLLPIFANSYESGRSSFVGCVLFTQLGAADKRVNELAYGYIALADENGGTSRDW